MCWQTPEPHPRGPDLYLLPTHREQYIRLQPSLSNLAHIDVDLLNGVGPGSGAGSSRGKPARPGSAGVSPAAGRPGRRAVRVVRDPEREPLVQPGTATGLERGEAAVVLRGPALKARDRSLVPSWRPGRRRSQRGSGWGCCAWSFRCSRRCRRCRAGPPRRLDRHAAEATVTVTDGRSEGGPWPFSSMSPSLKR